MFESLKRALWTGSFKKCQHKRWEYHDAEVSDSVYPDEWAYKQCVKCHEVRYLEDDFIEGSWNKTKGN